MVGHSEVWRARAPVWVFGLQMGDCEGVGQSHLQVAEEDLASMYSTKRVQVDQLDVTTPHP
jgi:hypothetical protein